VASSGLPVTISSNTTAVCTVAGTTLSLVAPGTCSLSATQSGNASYSAAVPVNNSFTVAAAGGIVLPGQAISFASPGAQKVGSPVVLTATASSGLAVTFSSSTPAVCALSGTTLNLLSAGNCTITANQAGNSSVAAAAPVSRTFAVTDPAAAPSAANGQTLYLGNCNICHGAAANGNMKVLTAANSPTTIQNAIGRNAGGMGALSGLSSQNLADIAAYLANPI
jgi:mono/diheme cytochrome c family protein